MAVKVQLTNSEEDSEAIKGLGMTLAGPTNYLDDRAEEGIHEYIELLKTFSHSASISDRDAKNP